MIKIKDLTVKYKNKLALNNVSFNIYPNEIIAFAGQNGAGKSTLLNSLVKFIPAGNMGFMSENGKPDSLLSVKEFIRFSGTLKGIFGSELENQTIFLIENCGLINNENSLCGTLSKGGKQRVMLASALIGNQDYLILDEPSAGLDPIFQKEFMSRIVKLKGKRTVIISTHNISEIETLADRIIILKDGCISFDGKPNGEKSYYEYF